MRSYIKFALIAVLCTEGVVLADWDIGDPALYYQTPDLAGWTVYSEWGSGPVVNQDYRVADDWTATTTTPITDIHFWGGWKNDAIGESTGILVRIFDNNPAEQGFPQPGSECVWRRVINQSEYTSRLLYPAEELGWYDPQGDNDWQAQNHDNIYQYSIPIIPNPFIQQAGQTYWLMITMDIEGSAWGWNSTQSVTGGSAVFWDKNASQWAQLTTPVGQTPLDLAFVLIPEPTTLFLFTIAGLFLRKRKV